MRLVSFVARTSQEAMALLRASLGEDAVVVTTQTMDDGQVRVTGAVGEDDFDLIDVLSPSEESVGFEWLSCLGEFHEWPCGWRQQLDPVLSEVRPADPHAILATLLRAIYRFESLAEQFEKPQLLSGPPGSGKTVTIAKLAASHVLAGRSVDVLSMDVGRAGAAEQLSTLLSPLGLQPIVVPEPGSLPTLVAECSGDVTLVDSPSTNPFGSADLGVLSSLARRARVDLVLVLPAGCSYADSAEIGESYATLGAKNMIVTKLDVAKRLGGILAAADAGLAFCEAGIGRTIGDGLHPLTADGLARLLLRRYHQSLDEEQLR